MSNERIASHHLSRKGLIYVRQSSMQQVLNNEESRRLQYAMEQHLRALGWTELEIIDDDLGRSAGGADQREGFQRMVAEVCMGRVGAVAARELSRFARNSRDWQQLVEVCRVVDTLLIDQETVYDARLGNDRLLLGLKGSLSEYELDLLRQRSHEARMEKARRGELLIAAPIGFVKTEKDRLEKVADRRIQEAIVLLFSKFLELGSARQTLMWLLEHGLDFPVQIRSRGSARIDWSRPRYSGILRILRHPAYGGAYVYGRQQAAVEYRDGVAKRVLRQRPREEWIVFPNWHEGYVDWSTFERIQRMLDDNAQSFPSGRGAPKRGRALLAGLLRCARCGRMLTIQYSGSRGNVARYACVRGRLDYGDPNCISLGGTAVDLAISNEILRVVRPAAVEASRRAAQLIAEGDSEVVAALERDLQAAEFAADRAGRQYDAADPANRLVVDELECRWNVALEHVAVVKRRLEEAQTRRVAHTPLDTSAVQELAGNLRRIWHDESSDVRIKKRIARTLIEEILVDVDSSAGQINLIIHWVGGVHTELPVRRRKRGENSQQSSIEAVEAIRLLSRVCTDEQIAGYLNRNGLLTGRGNRWTRERVCSARSKRGIARFSPTRKVDEGWLNLTEAARYLDVTHRTMRRFVDQGTIDSIVRTAVAKGPIFPSPTGACSA